MTFADTLVSSPQGHRRSGMAEILTDAPPRIAADAAAKMTAAEWKVKLSDFEFQVLRNKATERPRTGEYDNFYPSAGDGYFVWRGCGNPLYSAESKFKSGCGWPAFDKCYKGSVKIIEDNTHGMRRVEILCNNCDGHLGHGKLLRRARRTGTACSLTLSLTRASQFSRASA